MNKNKEFSYDDFQKVYKNLVKFMSESIDEFEKKPFQADDDVKLIEHFDPYLAKLLAERYELVIEMDKKIFAYMRKRDEYMKDFN